jgi:hypothetical protein
VIEEINEIPLYKEILIFNEIYRHLNPSKANEVFNEISKNNYVFVYNIMRSLQKEYNFLKPEYYLTMDRFADTKGYSEKYLEFFIEKYSTNKDSKNELTNIIQLHKDVQKIVGNHIKNNLEKEIYETLKEHLLNFFESRFYELNPQEEEEGLFVGSEIFKTIILITDIQESLQNASINHANDIDDPIYFLLRYVSLVIYIVNFHHSAGRKGERNFAAENERRNKVINNIEKAYKRIYPKDNFKEIVSDALGISDRQVRGYFEKDKTAGFKLHDIFVLEELGINRDFIVQELPKSSSIDPLIRIQRKLKHFRNIEGSQDKVAYVYRALDEIDDFFKVFEWDNRYYDDYLEKFKDKTKELKEEVKQKLHQKEGEK